MSHSRPFLAAAILLTLAILAALIALAPSKRAIHHDSAANFWFATTGVRLGITTPSLPFPSDAVHNGDRLVYGGQRAFKNYQDHPYQFVTEAEAQADFPRVQLELEKRAAVKDTDDYIAIGYKNWQYLAPDNRGIPGLLVCIDAANTEWANRLLTAWANNHVSPPLPFSYGEDMKQGLNHVASADRLYWATFLFEAIYLPFIVWFVLLPFIRRDRLRRKLLHTAALPLLLMLPCWFGYCNSASPAFPRGGILYPYVCVSPRFPDNYTWEFQFLAKLPPFLSVITQGRVVTFADYFSLRHSIPYQNGPVKVALVSALLTALVATGPLIKKLRSHRPPRGFPVLDPQPTESSPTTAPVTTTTSPPAPKYST